MAYTVSYIKSPKTVYDVAKNIKALSNQMKELVSELEKKTKPRPPKGEEPPAVTDIMGGMFSKDAFPPSVKTVIANVYAGKDAKLIECNAEDSYLVQETDIHNVKGIPVPGAVRCYLYAFEASTYKTSIPTANVYPITEDEYRLLSKTLKCKVVYDKQ